jgi:hypothetical protein
MATWTEFLRLECRDPQKYNIGDFVLIPDGSKSIKSKATIKAKIVGHEFIRKEGSVINGYNIEYLAFKHDYFPEDCIIRKL